LTVTKASYQTDALSQAIPLASIARHASSSEQRLSFCSPEDLDRAWELGIFYLKVPEHLDVEDARRFGSSSSQPIAPTDKFPNMASWKGLLRLENNQQTKLALRRERWDQHYPAHIAPLGAELDELGVAIMREVLRQSRIPEPLWDRASGGYASGGGDAFLNFVHYDTRHP
jgi:hypothetical protein